MLDNKSYLVENNVNQLIVDRNVKRGTYLFQHRHVVHMYTSHERVLPSNGTWNMFIESNNEIKTDRISY